VSQVPALPPEFDPRQKARTGGAVLEHGLPVLPDVLDYAMSVPVAFWAAAGCAVVVFLEFSSVHPGEVPQPRAKLKTFAREGDRWSAHRWSGGVGWAHDPIARPGDLRDLGGRMMAGGSGSFTASPDPGYPAAVVVGRVAPAVKHIALVQDGGEDRRVLRAYFGAWAVCTERWSPYRIDAIDASGTVLGSLQGPPRLPPRPAAGEGPASGG
jgi:hypothetical protein